VRTAKSVTYDSGWQHFTPDLFLKSIFSPNFAKSHRDMDDQPMDKKVIKTVLEEMLRERNPELKGFLEELLLNFFAAQANTDRTAPLDMVEVRKKYALHREAFAPLHKIFQDAPPAEEMVKKLRK